MAKITAEKVAGEHVSYVIKIIGKLDVHDGAEFHKKTHWIREANVEFISDGGDLLAGLSIGRQIKASRFSTEVKPWDLCASAAALAWLGGTPRVMDKNSGIGFHGAYVETPGGSVVNAKANALIGKYLHEMGLEDEAVGFITEASPQDLQFLGPGEAVALGIEVELSSGTLPAVEQDSDPHHSNITQICERAAREYRKATNRGGQTGAYLRVLATYRMARMIGDGNYALLAYIIDAMASDMDYWWMQHHPGLEHLPYNEEEQVLGRALEALVLLDISEESDRESIIAGWHNLVPQAQRHLIKLNEEEVESTEGEGLY